MNKAFRKGQLVGDGVPEATHEFRAYSAHLPGWKSANMERIGNQKITASMRRKLLTKRPLVPTGRQTVKNLTKGYNQVARDARDSLARALASHNVPTATVHGDSDTQLVHATP
jgi:hypothetical protein